MSSLSATALCALALGAVGRPYAVLWLGAAFTLDGGPGILLFGLLPEAFCAWVAAVLWG